MSVNLFTLDVGRMSSTWIFHVLDMKFIWTHNTGYNDIMYCTLYRTYVETHKNIWEPIILGFQMNCLEMAIYEKATICAKNLVRQ